MTAREGFSATKNRNNGVGNDVGLVMRRPIAAPAVIGKILSHLGLPTPAPDRKSVV
jgi:hypothetical protein